MKIVLRDARLEANTQGMATWYARARTVDADPARCAIIVCDVWDNHWCRGAVCRLQALLPRMNETLESARRQGMQIVHAPSDTMDFYAQSPARTRIREAAVTAPPAALALPDPVLPIDDSDHGSDTGEKVPARVWTRQHPALAIDPDRDVISDSGPEIYSWLQHTGCTRVFIMGVHTNMCILNRSFGIKQMVRWQVSIALIRDLTDSMYNPAMPPYVSHTSGTNLVIDYIERFWCPTLQSQYITGL